MYIQKHEEDEIMLAETVSIEALLESDGYEFLNEHKEIFMKFLSEDVTVVLNESDREHINKAVGKYMRDAKEFLDGAKKHANSVNPYTALNKAMLGVGLLSLFTGLLTVVSAGMDTPEAGVVFFMLSLISGLALLFMFIVTSTENAHRYRATTQHMNSLKTMRRKLLTFKAKTTNLKVESEIDEVVSKIDNFLSTWSNYNQMDEEERKEYNIQLQKERDLQAKEAIARNTANPTVVIVRESGQANHSF